MMSMGKQTTAICLLVLLCLASKAYGQVAFVVNPDCAVSSLEMKELKLIYLGKNSVLCDDLQVVLSGDKSLEKKVFSQLLGMTPMKVRKYWVKSVFAGNRTRPPISFSSARQLREFVADNPGAIAFLNLADVDETVKVIAVAGVLPGNDGYPID